MCCIALLYCIVSDLRVHSRGTPTQTHSEICDAHPTNRFLKKHPTLDLCMRIVSTIVSVFMILADIVLLLGSLLLLPLLIVLLWESS
ncbi:hypothetical protein CpB0064 [Chlamydia pneumoniae TW-183]|uniref:Uncharacterized protein n=2 Tax=Chlamydia pneumoniae TaxID=83558 RepID=A0ABM5LBX9_CHLPN|nr:hypothetical protein CpB0064 [Chlamydia pneumoniae TW-183]